MLRSGSVRGQRADDACSVGRALAPHRCGRVLTGSAPEEEISAVKSSRNDPCPIQMIYSYVLLIPDLRAFDTKTRYMFGNQISQHEISCGTIISFTYSGIISSNVCGLPAGVRPNAGPSQIIVLLLLNTILMIICKVVTRYLLAARCNTWDRHFDDPTSSILSWGLLQFLISLPLWLVSHLQTWPLILR